MYNTFYSIVFGSAPMLNKHELPMKTQELVINEISMRDNVLMIDVNCTPREMVKYLADHLGEDVRSIGLIIRNESFEPDWSFLENDNG